MVNLESHYKVLGLAPGSTLAAVKRAYLQEIKTWHPDRYSADSLLRSKAEERTKALTAAYAALVAALKPAREQASRPGHSPPDSVNTKETRTSHSPPRGPTESTVDKAESTAGEWVARVWRRLKAQWNDHSARPVSSSVTYRRKRRIAKPGARPSRRPRFDDVLEAARNAPQTPKDISVAWRRLAARRAHYGRRRGMGSAGIAPIKSRGPVRPVEPVDRIRAIGDDG